MALLGFVLKQKLLGTTGFSLFFLLPTGFFEGTRVFGWFSWFCELLAIFFSFSLIKTPFGSFWGIFCFFLGGSEAKPSEAGEELAAVWVFGCQVF